MPKQARAGSGRGRKTPGRRRAGLAPTGPVLVVLWRSDSPGSHVPKAADSSSTTPDPGPVRGIGVGLTLVYMFVSGQRRPHRCTIGNRLMGIRSADKDGYAPGGGAVFLRGLVTGAGMLLAVCRSRRGHFQMVRRGTVDPGAACSWVPRGPSSWWCPIPGTGTAGSGAGMTPPPRPSCSTSMPDATP